MKADAEIHRRVIENRVTMVKLCPKGNHEVNFYIKVKL